MYTYEMFQASPNIEVKAKEHWGNEAAAYQQHVVNAHAKDGREFYRIDTIGVSVKPGCFDALLGKGVGLEKTTLSVLS